MVPEEEELYEGDEEDSEEAAMLIPPDNWEDQFVAAGGTEPTSVKFRRRIVNLLKSKVYKNNTPAVLGSAYRFTPLRFGHSDVNDGFGRILTRRKTVALALGYSDFTAFENDINNPSLVMACTDSFEGRMAKRRMWTQTSEGSLPPLVDVDPTTAAATYVRLQYKVRRSTGTTSTVNARFSLRKIIVGTTPPTKYTFHFTTPLGLILGTLKILTPDGTTVVPFSTNVSLNVSGRTGKLTILTAGYTGPDFVFYESGVKQIALKLGVATSTYPVGGSNITLLDFFRSIPQCSKWNAQHATRITKAKRDAAATWLGAYSGHGTPSDAEPMFKSLDAAAAESAGWF